jgi:hypothetical protein
MNKLNEQINMKLDLELNIQMEILENLTIYFKAVTNLKINFN